MLFLCFVVFCTYPFIIFDVNKSDSSLRSKWYFRIILSFWGRWNDRNNLIFKKISWKSSIGISLQTELFAAYSQTLLRNEKWSMWKKGEKRIKSASGFLFFSDSSFFPRPASHIINPQQESSQSEHLLYCLSPWE